MDDPKHRYQEFLDFVEKYKNNYGFVGDFEKGEFELVLDISLFPECEKGAADRMLKNGVLLEDAKKRAEIGIFDENKCGVSVHEPLRLPDGSLTTYNRFIPWSVLQSKIAGVVVVQVSADGKLIFIKNFRNASKNWCMEFPRGEKDLDSSIVNTIKNELSEEMRAEMVGKPVKIGEVFPDSGVLSSRVEIRKVTIKITGDAVHDTVESIKGLEFLTKEQVKEILKTPTFKDDDGKEYEFKDGFTLSALQLLSV